MTKRFHGALPSLALGLLAPGLLALGLVACGAGSGGESHDDEHTAGGEDHADLSAYEGPVTGDAAAGAEVFANFCAGCHPGSGPDLNGRMESPAEVRLIVRNGDGNMPAFEEGVLSDADLENVLAHLNSEYGMF